MSLDVIAEAREVVGAELVLLVDLVQHLDRHEQQRLIVVLRVVELVLEPRQRAAVVTDHRQRDGFTREPVVDVLPRVRRFFDHIEGLPAVAGSQ